MKRILLTISMAALAITACQNQTEDYAWVKNGIDTASQQLKRTAEEIKGTGMLPRSIRVGYDMDFLERQLERDRSTFADSLRAIPAPGQEGQRRLCNVYDWTSGFFPGSLWYAYELTGDEALKSEAVHYTELLDPIRRYTGTHDLGFMINCSYGNALRRQCSQAFAQ